MTEQEGLPLPNLFKRALENASQAYFKPTMQSETQELVQSAVNDLLRVINGISSLSLFSSNETVDDLATGDLIYLIVPYALSEISSRLKMEHEDERIEVIQNSQRLLKGFIERLEEYGIVSEADIKLARAAQPVNDHAKRRESKIQQFKHEKDLKARVLAMRQRRIKASDVEDSNDFTLFASLLSSSSSNAQNHDGDNDHDDEIERETSILVLRLYYGQAHSQLKSLEEELELLRQMRQFESPMRSQMADTSDETWRLDQLNPGSSILDAKGPLMDSSGKPLRPFTILPSTSASERSRLRAEVFRPDYRLPTMTIDEYLEEEQRRGNIISGGGPQTGLTESEQLSLDAEMDGSLTGDVKSEDKRLKDESWAQYTDFNPKGAGNTMNRG